ncbi:MAG: hypothetical protein FJX74_09815, partial [Armatimonadetes bacterium]|nr:hypothetical protein [Armatimonadota bacterium]
MVWSGACAKPGPQVIRTPGPSCGCTPLCTVARGSRAPPVGSASIRSWPPSPAFRMRPCSWGATTGSRCGVSRPGESGCQGFWLTSCRWPSTAAGTDHSPLPPSEDMPPRKTKPPLRRRSNGPAGPNHHGSPPMDAPYSDALAYLHSLIDFEKLGAVYFGRDRFQLATVRRLLAALGEPQTRLRIVHIAGTKGKGSTAAILDSILRAGGLRVGLFTQPHLVDMRERTRVDGRPLTEADFVAAVAAIRPEVDRLNAGSEGEPVTFYEAHLAAALTAFAARGVEVAVMETGLGGRLDATNALSPIATAITRIDYDHTDILGERLEDIAREKAGILKPGVPCVFAPQAPEVAEVLRQQAAAVGAPVRPCPEVIERGDGSFDLRGARPYEGLRLPLAGRHQR